MWKFCHENRVKCEFLSNIYYCVTSKDSQTAINLWAYWYEVDKTKYSKYLKKKNYFISHSRSIEQLWT